MVEVTEYVRRFIGIIDDFVENNLDMLRGKDLANFYNTLFRNLKDTFGGAWGFHGVPEFLTLRTLYHLGVKMFAEEPDMLPVTNELSGFLYKRVGLALAAGRPLAISPAISPDARKRLWPDITVYKPRDVNDLRDVKEVISILEIKARIPSIKEIKDTVRKLESVRRQHGGKNYAIIFYVYRAKSSGTKPLRLLSGEEVDGFKLPSYLDVILLDRDDRRVEDIFAKYLAP